MPPTPTMPALPRRTVAQAVDALEKLMARGPVVFVLDNGITVTATRVPTLDDEREIDLLYTDGAGGA